MSMPMTAEKAEDALVSTPMHSHGLVPGYAFWLFGFTGSHRFYYGRPLSGLVWFLTLGLLGVGWIVDLFLIPGMSDEASARFRCGRYSYPISWALLIFVGIFGVHRFYLGRWVSGIAYLLTGGIFGLGVIYDIATLNTLIDERNRGH